MIAFGDYLEIISKYTNTRNLVFDQGKIKKVLEYYTTGRATK